MRLLLPVAAALLMLSATSCTKSYNCDCVTEYFNSGVKSKEETSSDEITSISKKIAKEDCEGLNDGPIENSGFEVKKTCTLK